MAANPLEIDGRVVNLGDPSFSVVVSRRIDGGDKKEEEEEGEPKGERIW